MTGTEYLRQVYLAAKPGLRNGTRQQYAISAASLDAFSGSEIEDWNAAMLTRWLASLPDSAATVNSKRRAACTLWRHYDRRAPVDEVPRRREPRRIPQAWTVAEIGSILDQCRIQRGTNDGIPWSDWWESLLLACWDSGHRISALLATATADCNLVDGWLLVRAEEEKTWQDKVFALAPDTIDAISRHYTAARKRLWPWPFHRNTIWSRFRRIVLAAGVRYPGGHCNLFHRIRRSTGSALEQQGASGARHLGISDAVFRRSYLDPTFTTSQVHLLPRPTAKQSLRIVG